MRGFSAHLAMRFAADTLPVRASALRASPARLAAAHVSRQTAATPIPVLGRWQLVRQISTDEHTILYEARPITQRADAPADYLVKVARQDSGGIAAALLWREQAVAHSASHPHLAAVLDGKVRGMTPFLVLANVGTPLSSSAYAPGHLRLALWRTRQTSAALAALHAAGWIHARLGPTALLVSPRGHLTVHELGWARRIGSGECRGEHLLAADLRYVAPEMLCDATELTPACDVYCLGLLLIELLIGRPAVDAVVGWQAALAQLRGEISDVRDLQPALPPRLVELIRSMTAREPLRRPHAEEIHREIVQLEVRCLNDVRTSRRPGQPGQSQ